MSEALIIAIVTALIAGPIGAGITAWVNHSKDAASISKMITESARELIAEYKAQADDLQEKVACLEVELQVQAKALENINAQVLKYRLALVITVMQLRLAGFEPMIDPTTIDSMSVDELKMVAEGARNVERRRQGDDRSE